MIGLFAAIGVIVVVALVVAWRVRFRSGGREFPDASSGTEVARPNGAPAGPGVAKPVESGLLLPAVPLPPSEFLAAVETAIGQEVLFLRLRTPSNVFKLEAPRRGA